MAERSPDPTSGWLGPNTEALFERAFATRAVIPANKAAGVVGLDVKTLGALSDAGVIRAVRRGVKALRGYTERDLRAYLLETGTAPCRTPQPRIQPTAVKSARIVPFSAVLAAQAPPGRR